MNLPQRFLIQRPRNHSDAGRLLVGPRPGVPEALLIQGRIGYHRDPIPLAVPCVLFRDPPSEHRNGNVSAGQEREVRDEPRRRKEGPGEKGPHVTGGRVVGAPFAKATIGGDSRWPSRRPRVRRVSRRGAECSRRLLRVRRRAPRDVPDTGIRPCHPSSARTRALLSRMGSRGRPSPSYEQSRP